jgi:hypothetical protein
MKRNWVRLSTVSLLLLQMPFLSLFLNDKDKPAKSSKLTAGKPGFPIIKKASVPLPSEKTPVQNVCDGFYVDKVIIEYTVGDKKVVQTQRTSPSTIKLASDENLEFEVPKGMESFYVNRVGFNSKTDKKAISRILQEANVKPEQVGIDIENLKVTEAVKFYGFFERLNAAADHMEAADIPENDAENVIPKAVQIERSLRFEGLENQLTLHVLNKSTQEWDTVNISNLKLDEGEKLFVTTYLKVRPSDHELSKIVNSGEKSMIIEKR